MPKPMSMGHGRRTAGGGAEGGRPKADFSALGRAIKRLFVYYPRMAPLTMCCILFSSVVSAIPSLFTQNVIAVIERWYKTGDWAAARPEVLRYVTVLAALYVLALISSTAYTQLMAVMTQGYLNKLRQETFGRMQDLPVRFFDTHQHGDIMSYYTNDIDTLRMLISQSLPTFIQSGSVVLVVFAIMLYFSLWMTLVLLVGVAAMFFVTKTVGGGSARYFVKQQQSLAETEGIIQELMNGQKVVKVFCHEAEAIRDFDARNDALRENSRKANAYANILGPIMNNIGNILYVVLALAGGVFLLSGVTNISLSGKPFSISVLVPFLGMAKQFTGNVNTLAQQINQIVMASAGAGRVFSLMDQEPEPDQGYVTLVNVREEPDGTLTETDERTGHWAWRHPSSARPARARPRSPTSSTASTTSPTARSATTASTSTRSRRRTCAARSASSCRTPTSSPARSWTTSATAVSTPPTRNASRPRASRARTISSPASRRATRPS